MPHLELRAVQAGYRRGFRLAPVERTLGPGLYHLCGPNGCGKTTLLRTIAGELRARAGSVWLNGHDTWAEPAARRCIGFLSAEPELPGFLTVDEAWRFAARIRGDRAWRAGPLLAELGLPPALRLAQCSHGQRRAAELLSAVAADPSLLLLDEPLAGLDRAAVATVSAWLVGWADARIVVLTGHADEAVLQLAERWELPIVADAGG